MVRLKGLIFDLDGTLGNTVPVCYAAFHEALLAHTGREYADAEIDAMFGPSEEGMIHRIVPAERRQACLEDYLAAYERLHDLAPRPFPGIAEALENLRRRGMRLGLVTGKGPRSAAISLRRLGLAEAFDVIEVGSPEGAVKPEAIRRILADWSLAPEQAGYVGDTASDIVAAREAGVVPLAAAWAPTARRDELLAAQPAALFTDVAQLVTWAETTAPDDVERAGQA